MAQTISPVWRMKEGGEYFLILMDTGECGEVCGWVGCLWELRVDDVVWSKWKGVSWGLLVGVGGWVFNTERGC